jgi:cobalamin-dependent methionine synthase-like protein
MDGTVPIPLEEILPSAASILEAQGIPTGRNPGARSQKLAEEALACFLECAQPRGMGLEISRDRFLEIYEGEGRNDPESPVGPIARAADALALFAVTMGEPISLEISQRFRQEDFARGLMLDAAASAGADLAAGWMEERYRRRLAEKARLGARHGILRFSPGYCGWDLSSQRALFRVLGPEAIGIRLNPSCLMRPLKSVSGVIVAGDRKIFEFDDTFSFCAECATHECRERIRALGAS